MRSARPVFVPNPAMGPKCVEALRDRTLWPMEVHLMVEQPAAVMPIYANAGAARLIIHSEACPQLHRDVAAAERLGAQIGVALNPGTPLMALDYVLRELDEVLLMGVDPGFGGQSFIEAVMVMVTHARKMTDAHGDRAKLNIDSGVKENNAAALASAGADRLLVGSALFGPAGTIRSCPGPTPSDVRAARWIWPCS